SGDLDYPDQETFARYGDGATSIEDWRRENIDLLVREMHERIRAEKPWVRFGISPFGIWRNASSDPQGSDTSGSESYDLISADTDVGLYIGEAAYKAVEGVFEEVSELGDHLDLTGSLPAVDGNVFFSAKSLRTDTTGAVDDLLERHYAHPAIVPMLDQVPGEAPPAPRVLVARSTGDGVQVRWLGHGATSYALWHLPTPEVREEDLADGRRLVA